jgi:hypothetical protein
VRQLVKIKKAGCGKTEVTADVSSITLITEKMEMDITQYGGYKGIEREVNCMVTMKPATGQSH